MCTKLDTVVTTINMITVILSNIKPNGTTNTPASIQSNSGTYIVFPLTPTSYNANQDITLVNTTKLEVIIPAPFPPISLPNSPLILALNKGTNNINRYIF